MFAQSKTFSNGRWKKKGLMTVEGVMRRGLIREEAEADLPKLGDAYPPWFSHSLPHCFGRVYHYSGRALSKSFRFASLRKKGQRVGKREKEQGLYFCI